MPGAINLGAMPEHVIVAGGLNPYLLEDYFADAEGTAIANHVPNRIITGDAWTSAVAGLVIESNAVSDNRADGVAVIDVGQANVEITCGMTIQGGNFFGLCLRYQDSNNFLILGADIALDKVACWQNVAGAFTEIGGNANGSQAFTDGDIVSVVVRLNGAGIQALFNSTLDINISDTDFETETEFGIYIDGSAWTADGSLDNMLIVNYST